MREFSAEATLSLVNCEISFHAIVPLKVIEIYEIRWNKKNMMDKAIDFLNQT